MKKLILISALVTACTSISTKPLLSEITFKDLKKLIINVTTEKEVFEQFGPVKPGSTEEQTYFVEYKSINSDYQRLIIYFDLKTKKIKSFIWFPNAKDDEISILKVKEMFKGLNLVEVHKKTDHHHFIEDTITLEDHTNGVVIGSNADNKSVQYIAYVGSEDRAAASSEK